MTTVAILSEDRVFSSLVARNLRAQGHDVQIYLVNQWNPTSFLASQAASTISIWVLDMGWFDDRRRQGYAALVRWCSHLYQPSILLMDNSWAYKDIQAFHATAALTKPFAMHCLLQVTRELSGEPLPEQPTQP